MDVSFDRFFAAPTLESLLEAQRTNRPDPDRFLTFNRNGARPPIFLFPGLSGTPFIYNDLPLAFGPDQPVHVATAIGAGEQDAAVEPTMEGLAEIYKEALLPLLNYTSVILGGIQLRRAGGVSTRPRIAPSRHHRIPLNQFRRCGAWLSRVLALVRPLEEPPHASGGRGQRGPQALRFRPHRQRSATDLPGAGSRSRALEGGAFG